MPSTNKHVSMLRAVSLLLSYSEQASGIAGASLLGSKTLEQPYPTVGCALSTRTCFTGLPHA
jgi:hypothetical protein